MNQNQLLFQKREKLNSYLGQLIDLQNGNYKELVLPKDSDEILLLVEVIQEAIKNIDNELKMDTDLEIQAEEEKKYKYNPNLTDFKEPV